MTTVTPARPVLRVEDLSVDFQVGGEWVPATKEVSFEVRTGEILAVVGESGSGKSVSSMSVLGLLAPNSRRRGRIMLEDVDLTATTGETLREIRGDDVAMIFQEPMTALNPVHTVGRQIVEAIRVHRSVDKATAKARAVELLRSVGLPDPERRVDHYPHQLSGGQRQRAMIAMAIACEPRVLIADEPTTALDVTVQAEILALLRDLRDRLDSAIVLITHDMGVVADLADRVVVMEKGVVVEQAPVAELFAAPRHTYTQKLLAAVPHLGRRESSTLVGSRTTQEPADTRPEQELALDVDDVVLEYPGRAGAPPFRALDHVSVQIPKGEVLGLVGESGSGKSTLGRVVAGLLSPTSGRVTACGTDLTGLSERRLRPYRSRFSMVFQDPASSLNPRLTIGECVTEPLLLQHTERREGRRRRARELLDLVELPPDWVDRYPHELSGGQRQRVGIARAIALEPELLVADEPTSALDVSVQATVLRLFLDLQQRLGFSCLFITHDLAVVELLADRIAVLRAGVVVEQGSRATVLGAPEEDYTKRLILSAPVPDPAAQRRRRESLASASPGQPLSSGPVATSPTPRAAGAR